MIPCYVSGAGRFAGDATRDFKQLVILWLEHSGLGYDTRYRYYRAQFPDFDPARLARMVCDPIEYYDRAWASYRDAQARAGVKEEEALVHFVVDRDARFRAEAEIAIYCFDEAGIGSGVNAMRFIHDGTPVLGFYAADPNRRRINLTNVLQLRVEFPEKVLLASYRTPQEITAQLAVWLPALRRLTSL